MTKVLDIIDDAINGGELSDDEDEWPLYLAKQDPTVDQKFLVRSAQEDEVRPSSKTTQDDMPAHMLGGLRPTIVEDDSGASVKPQESPDLAKVGIPLKPQEASPGASGTLSVPLSEGLTKGQPALPAGSEGNKPRPENSGLSEAQVSQKERPPFYIGPSGVKWVKVSRFNSATNSWVSSYIKEEGILGNLEFEDNITAKEAEPSPWRKGFLSFDDTVFLVKSRQDILKLCPYETRELSAEWWQGYWRAATNWWREQQRAKHLIDYIGDFCD